MTQHSKDGVLDALADMIIESDSVSDKELQDFFGIVQHASTKEIQALGRPMRALPWTIPVIVKTTLLKNTILSAPTPSLRAWKKLCAWEQKMLLHAERNSSSKI